MAKSEKIPPQRLEKLKRLRELGLNPYPSAYQRTHDNASALAFFHKHESDTALLAGTQFSLAGRVMSIRLMGKMAFVDIRDVSAKIQLHFSQTNLGETFPLLKEVDLGDFIGVKGTLFCTRSGEITLEVAWLTVLSKSLHALPEKWHGLVDVEKRYRQRYLDLISNVETRELFLKRSGIITAIRQFFDSKGYIEVETPVFQQLAGGATAKPFITHHHALGEDLYLRIALELYLKRLIVGGMDKVYEIGRVFRNEGISTRHNPEFTMLESYAAYSDYIDIMQLVEEMISHVANLVLGTSHIKYGGNDINLNPPWKRIPLRQALIDSCKIDFLQYPDAQSLGRKMKELKMPLDTAKDKGKLIDELISAYVEPELVQPVFLVDYPIEMSPLAKTKAEDERVVERFEGFIAGIEVANAFSELNDPLEQEKRFIQQIQQKQPDDKSGEIPEAIDDDFLLALEYGMPPTGGLGIGIDRLVMILLDKASIREVILFPQLKSK